MSFRSDKRINLGESVARAGKQKRSNKRRHKNDAATQIRAHSSAFVPVQGTVRYHLSISTLFFNCNAFLRLSSTKGNVDEECASTLDSFQINCLKAPAIVSSTACRHGRCRHRNHAVYPKFWFGEPKCCLKTDLARSLNMSSR